MTKIPLASVKGAVTAFVKDGGKCLITGEPGSGKNYVARKTMSNPKVWCFLDDYGQDREGRWMVNIPENIRREALVFVGIADNLYDQLPLLMETKAEGVKSSKLEVLFVNPDPEIFRKANLLKAETEKDVPETWRKYWLAKSKFSDAAVTKYMRNELNNLVKRITAIAGEHGFEVSFIEVENKLNGAVSKGWDEEDSKADVKKASDQEGGKHE